MTEIKHYSCKNRELISPKKKMKEGILENQGTEDRINMVGGPNWEEVGYVKDIMEALMNLAALEFSIRPHSFQALLMLRVIHDNDLGSNHVGRPFMGTNREQNLLLEAFCNECLLRNNSRTMEGGRPPGVQGSREGATQLLKWNRKTTWF